MRKLKQRSQKMESNYCVLPFKSFSINPSGEIRVCCNNGHVPAPYPTLAESDEVLNTDFMQKIRTQFINNEKPTICDRCWKQEEANARSFRYLANNDYNFGIKDGEVAKATPRVSFEDIEYCDISIGNHCNLACRMCNPYSSSLVAKEIADMNNKPEPKVITPPKDDKKKIFEVLEKAVNLNTLYLLGGEPLITDLHEEILDLLIDSGRSQNVILRLSTNLQTNKLDKFTEKWSKFKSVELQVSIDGCGDMYEYIRWPGKWSKLYDNLTHLIEAAKFSRKKIRPNIASTIQNINCLNLLELVKTCCVINRYPVGFYFIPVTSGIGIASEDLFITPKRILREAYKIQEKLQHKVGGYIPLHDYERYLLSAISREPTINEAKAFFSKYKEFDIRRKQNLFEVAPFMEEIADQFKIKKW